MLSDTLQVKKLVPEAPTGEYTLRKLRDQPEEQFSSTVIYSTLTARCDMDTDGGGWMVIQRRLPGGNVNFTRNWADYENGFGNLSGEFWYGLKNIHHLTTRDHVELRIDMMRESDGGRFSWTYQTFRVAGAADKYRLTIGEGEGTGYDRMAYHNDQQFTTYDNDNDKYHLNCGYNNQGGWWYKSCLSVNLNGPHETPSLPGVNPGYANVRWYGTLLSSVEMKIRVKQCVPETC